MTKGIKMSLNSIPTKEQIKEILYNNTDEKVWSITWTTGETVCFIGKTVLDALLQNGHQEDDLKKIQTWELVS
jgi:hypothetical protein